MSSIARRLDQLGALTKGQRDASSTGLFSAKDNLESPIARESLEVFLRNLVANRVPSITEKISAENLLNMMGLGKIFLRMGF